MHEQGNDLRALRRRAESVLADQGPAAEAQGIEGSQEGGALRELRLHQIELEMQNQALREAQADLEHSRQDYRNLCDWAPIAYLRLGPDALISYANDAARRLLGETLHEIVGTPFTRFVTPDDAARFVLHRGEVNAADQGLVLDVALRVGDRDREVRLFSVRSGPPGSSELLLAIVDLSEQIRLERGLKEHAFTSAVLNAAGLLVVVDGYGKIVRVNHKCAVLVGEDRSVLRRDFSDTFAIGGQRDLVHSKLMLTWEQGLSQSWESSFSTPSQGLRWISWSSTPLTSGDAAGHMIVSGVDITQRKQLQQQLLLSDRLAAVGTLAAGMAHEINNPLGYVMTSVDVATGILRRRGLLDPQDARLMERLETIQEGCERIRDIVRDLRAFCRNEPVVLEAVDVRSVLETSMKLAQNDVLHRARVVQDCNDVPRVHASARRLAQVFLNLIANAAQAIPPGNADAHEIRVGVRADDGWVLVEIEDTGEGIAEEHLPHVFDPFFTTKPTGGVGLGLSVCHNIITECGGRIAVDSMPGRGTRFRVSLPAIVEASDEPPRESAVVEARPSSVVPAQESLRILVIDDEPQVAQTVAQMLAAHRVEIAFNGQRAIEACERAYFDVILCDLLMPQMTGIDVYESLRAMGTGLHERIVFMTGCLTGPEDLPSPSVPVLSKPFTRAELVELVESRRPAAVDRGVVERVRRAQ